MPAKKNKKLYPDRWAIMHLTKPMQAHNALRAAAGGPLDGWYDQGVADQISAEVARRRLARQPAAGL